MGNFRKYAHNSFHFNLVRKEKAELFRRARKASFKFHFLNTNPRYNKYNLEKLWKYNKERDEAITSRLNDPQTYYEHLKNYKKYGDPIPPYDPNRGNYITAAEAAAGIITMAAKRFLQNKWNKKRTGKTKKPINKRKWPLIDLS